MKVFDRVLADRAIYAACFACINTIVILSDGFGGFICNSLSDGKSKKHNQGLAFRKSAWHMLRFLCEEGGSKLVVAAHYFQLSRLLNLRQAWTSARYGSQTDNYSQFRTRS